MTRAVLLTSSGAVHRVIAGPDGGDQTACGERYGRHVPVTPNQALVYNLPECHSGWQCWGRGMWNSFREGVGT